MNDRPVPPGYAHEGHEWIAQESPYPWQIFNGSRRFCVAGGGRPCNRKAVATLTRAQGKGTRKWHYCGDHLYGRWIEDGRIMEWVLREIP